MGYVCHVVPSIWVHFFVLDIPQNGSVSESLKHTHVKSTPIHLVTGNECRVFLSISCISLLLALSDERRIPNEFFSYHFELR